MTCWKTWYRSLTREEKDAYAQRAGTTRTYIEIQLISRRRRPRPDLMARLATATLGRVSHEDVVLYFFPRADQAA